ncbi:MAG TPA: regulatory iron-sulfur-containing complex subunit RicT [Phycisphaerae bacterium]|nr:regulatory iron-sulfur-containing complex subunit RicT [Phycisphaerae bacterium]
MSEDAKQEQVEPPRPGGNGDQSTVAVRYGFLKFLGEFRCRPDVALRGLSTRVVIQSDRGIEIGETVNLTHCGACGAAVSPERINSYVEACGEEYLRPNVGRVLRIASDQDLHEQERLNQDASQKLALCEDLARGYELTIKLVACEHLFGGERIIFYFMADGRVDFRQLVRDLAHEYQTRIEMRQIGARDEARLVADFEICGQECCCKTFLKALRPVSMKMAKMQKATLDPSKVSGRCGRLRCCLRYEHASYQELLKRLPPLGELVGSPQGVGRVTDRHIITQLVQLTTDDGRTVVASVEELTDPNEPAPEVEEVAEPAPTPKRPPPSQQQEAVDTPVETAADTPNETSAEAAKQGASEAAVPREGQSSAKPSDRSRKRRRRRGPRRRAPRGGSGNDASPKPDRPGGSSDST